MAKEFFKKVALGVAIALVSTATVAGVSALAKAIRGDDEAVSSDDGVKYCTHTGLIEIPGVAPTCTDPGATEGGMCASCGGIIKRQDYLDPLGHTEIPIPGVAPTCTEQGLTQGTECNVCGEILLQQSVLPAVGHDLVVIPAVPATCTTTGLTEGQKCTKCNIVVVEQQIVPRSHKNADLDSTCDYCGVEVVAQEIAAVVGEYVCGNTYRLYRNSVEVKFSGNSEFVGLYGGVNQNFLFDTPTQYIPEGGSIIVNETSEYIDYSFDVGSVGPSGGNSFLVIDESTYITRIGKADSFYRLIWVDKT